MTELTEPSITARTAARWWADRIRDGLDTKHDAGAEPGDIMDSPAARGLMTMAHAAGLMGFERPGAIDTFEETLARSIQERIDVRPDWMCFGCDYGPDLIFDEAFAAAGVKPGMALPIKTQMWIKDGEVEVSYGYAAPIEPVPLLEEIA